EIGLAVVATTFSIVAVFLPVGLMPGISGQFFKNFGLTVVAAVLMSLAVARLITPMIAAYFLHAKGHAEHAGGPLMDRYLKLLNWTLNEERVDAYRARLQPQPSRGWYYAVEFAFALLVAAAIFAVFWYGGLVLPADALPAWAVVTLKVVVAIAVALVARIVIRGIAAGLGDEFAAWHAYFAGRVRGRG